MRLDSSAAVDVRYDDGDVEVQKPRKRVRPLRAEPNGGGADATPTLKHARHSHVAFVVGKAASAGKRRAEAAGAIAGVKLAMLEEVS